MMRHYIVYDKDTKRVIREGMCNDEQLARQVLYTNEAVTRSIGVVKETYVRFVEATEDPE